MQPLVVTLGLSADVQAGMDGLRSRYFPRGRTQVGAHLTLFHAVPAELEHDVRRDLATVMRDGPIALHIARVISLGGGAAISVESDSLVRRHRTLQRAWYPQLTAQDQQPLRAHITVQNKVSARVARDTVAELEATFEPFDTVAPGIDLWRYDGGPWTHLTRFTGPEA